MNSEIKWSFIVFENNFYLWLWGPLRLLQGHLKKNIVRGDIILRKTECFIHYLSALNFGKILVSFQRIINPLLFNSNNTKKLHCD